MIRQTHYGQWVIRNVFFNEGYDMSSEKKW